MKDSHPAVEAALDHASELGEHGVQVAAYLHGELLVDAWAGTVAPESTTPVDDQTIFAAFSVSKPITATAVHLLVERGVLEYDAPIATYWPEYGQSGKEEVTLRHVPTHRSGVPPHASRPHSRHHRGLGANRPRAGTRPAHFPPNARNTYDEILAPLDMTDFWFGLPDEVEPRVATLTEPSPRRPANPGACCMQRFRRRPASYLPPTTIPPCGEPSSPPLDMETPGPSVRPGPSEAE